MANALITFALNINAPLVYVMTVSSLSVNSRGPDHQCNWPSLTITSSASSLCFGSSHGWPPAFITFVVLLLVCMLHERGVQANQQRLSSSSMATCPKGCSCKWTNGKETVDCHAANFNVIPDVLDPGTQVLDLTRNKLFHLAGFVFARVHLTNLQKIRLESCRLRTIDDKALANLTNLIDLNLSNNHLTSVPSTALSEAPNLRELVLNGNPLSQVMDKAFSGLPQLSHLEMTRCDLVNIDAGAFSGLRHLRTLKLNANRLVTLKSGLFNPLLNLHGVLLHDNPWRCDCHLLPTRKWMEDRKVPLTIPPNCASPPRIADIPWTQLDLDEYACLPTINPIRETVNGFAGRNVTVACTARGSPSAEVFWQAKSKDLVNHSFLPSDVQKPVVSSQTNSSAVTSAATNRVPSKPQEPQQHKQTIPSNEQQQMVTIWESDRAGRQEAELLRSSYLTVVDAQEANSGIFVCIASNKAGKVSANVTLVIMREGRVKFRGMLSSGITTGLGIFAVLLLLVLLCLFCGVVIKKKRRGNHVQSTGDPFISVSAPSSATRDPLLKKSPPGNDAGRAPYRRVPDTEGGAVVFANHRTGDSSDFERVKKPSTGKNLRDGKKLEEAPTENTAQNMLAHDPEELFPKMMVSQTSDAIDEASSQNVTNDSSKGSTKPSDGTDKDEGISSCSAPKDETIAISSNKPLTWDDSRQQASRRFEQRATANRLLKEDEPTMKTAPGLAAETITQRPATSALKELRNQAPEREIKYFGGSSFPANPETWRTSNLASVRFRDSLQPEQYSTRRFQQPTRDLSAYMEKQEAGPSRSFPMEMGALAQAYYSRPSFSGVQHSLGKEVVDSRLDMNENPSGNRRRMGNFQGILPGQGQARRKFNSLPSNREGLPIHHRRLLSADTSPVLLPTTSIPRKITPQNPESFLLRRRELLQSRLAEEESKQQWKTGLVKDYTPDYSLLHMDHSFSTEPMFSRAYREPDQPNQSYLLASRTPSFLDYCDTKRDRHPRRDDLYAFDRGAREQRIIARSPPIDGYLI